MKGHACRRYWVLAGIALATGLRAQLVQPDLRHFTTRDGLSHDQVWSMAKDRREHLWIGTLDGLNRFDGRHFKVYRPDGTPRSLPGRVIFTLLADDTGPLYVGTDAPYLTILDPIADTLANLPLPADTVALDDERHVHHILRDRSGRIWFSHGSRAISRLDSDRRSLRTFELPLPEGTPEGRRGTGRIMEDGRGIFWITVYKGLIRFDPSSGGSMVVPLHPKPGTPGKGFAFQVTGLIDEDSTLLIGTFAEGIFRMRKIDGEVVRLWPGPDHVPTYVDHMVGDLLRQPDGSVLVAVVDQGVLRLDPRTGAMEHHDRSLIPVRCRMVEDLLLGAWRFLRDGEDVWIGTNGGGFALWAARNDRHRAIALPHHPEGGRNEFVRGLTRDAATGRWLALTNSRGLYVYESDGAYGGFLPFPREAQPMGALGITTTGDGRAWITTSQRLLLADVRDLRWLPLPFTAEGGCDRWLWWMVPDGTGGAWCCTKDDQLTHLDLRSGGCASLTERKPATAGIMTGPVEDAVVDPDGRLWVALRDTVPFVVDVHGRVIPLASPNGLGSLRGTRLRQGVHGGVVLVTKGHGALLVRMSDAGQVRYDPIDGEGDEVLDAIAMNDGSFWVERRDGVFHLDSIGGRRTGLLHKDGIPSVDLRFECTPRPIDAPLLVGVWEGLLCLDVERLNVEVPAPGLQVPKVFAMDSLVAQHADLPGSGIELPHDRNRMVFELRSTNLADPQRDRYAYRLLGSDTSWTEIPPQDLITFSDLSPAAYTLELKARTNGSGWGAITRVPFIILPPFWATWWFRAIIGALIVLLAWSVFRLVLRLRLARQRRQLERERAVLEERIRIAHDLHDDLGSGLASIGMESELAAMEAGEDTAREALKRVSEGARNVGDDMRRIIWAMGSGQETLGDLVAYVRGFAGEMLEQAGIEFEFRHDLTDPARKLTVDQRKHLALFCKEALHNVVKHAAAANVTMRFTSSTDALEIAIADDGRGFDRGSGLRTGTGTTSMQERAKALGGRVSLDSAAGRGTTITLTTHLAPVEF